MQRPPLLLLLLPRLNKNRLYDSGNIPTAE